MALEIFKLVGSIFVDNDAANNSIAKTEEAAEKTGNTFSKTTEKVKKWAAALGAAAVAGATALGAMAVKSAETADHIDKMSQKLGISRQAYQELDYVLSQNGMQIDTLQAGMKKIASAMSDAADGTKSAQEKFEKLGISIYDSSGKLRTQEEVLKDAIRKFQEMEDGAEKAALATEIFGKSGQEMIPLLNSEAGSMDALIQKANDMGMVMGDDAINAGVKFSDTYDTMKRSLSAVAMSIGAEVLPLITSMCQFIIDHMPEIQATIQAISDFVRPILEWFIDAIASIINFISEVVDWINENEEAATLLGIAIATITAAIIAYEIAMNAATIATTIATAATTAFGAVMAFVTSPITLIILAIGALVAAVYLLVENWDAVSEAAGDAWNYVKEIWNGACDWFYDTVIYPIERAFESLGDSIADIWDGIKMSFLRVVQGAIDAFNDSLGRINIKIPSWVPGLGGERFGIPKIDNVLADGGVVDRGQLFIANEKGPEMVASFDGKTGVINNNQMLDVVEGGVARAASSVMGTGNISEETLYRAVKRALDESTIMATVPEDEIFDAARRKGKAFFDSTKKNAYIW